jgi:hypothetical protein
MINKDENKSVGVRLGLCHCSWLKAVRVIKWHRCLAEAETEDSVKELIFPHILSVCAMTAYIL